MARALVLLVVSLVRVMPNNATEANEREPGSQPATRAVYWNWGSLVLEDGQGNLTRVDQVLRRRVIVRWCREHRVAFHEGPLPRRVALGLGAPSMAAPV